jgi:hypothetical protein
MHGIRFSTTAGKLNLALIERYLYKLYQSILTKMPQAGGEYSRQKIHVLVLLTLA